MRGRITYVHHSLPPGNKKQRIAWPFNCHSSILLCKTTKSRTVIFGTFVYFLLCFCLLLSKEMVWAGTLQGELQKSNISSWSVYGQINSYDQTLLIKNGELFLPINKVASELSNCVRSYYNEVLNKKNTGILIRFGNDTMKLTEGEPHALINGEAVLLSYPPQSIDGNLWVPMSFFTKNMQIHVEQDDVNKTVVLQAAIWNGLNVEFNECYAWYYRRFMPPYGPILAVDVERDNYSSLEKEMQKIFPDFKRNDYTAANQTTETGIIRTYWNIEDKELQVPSNLIRNVAVTIENSLAVLLDSHIEGSPEYHSYFNKTKVVRRYGDQKGTTYYPKVTVDLETGNFEAVDKFIEDAIPTISTEQMNVENRTFDNGVSRQYYFKNKSGKSVVDVTIEQDGYVSIVADNTGEQEAREAKEYTAAKYEYDAYNESIDKYFDMKLYTEKEYKAGEPVMPYLEITYIGPGDSVTMYHSCPGLYMGIAKEGEAVLTGFDNIGATTVFNKGETKRFTYIPERQAFIDSNDLRHDCFYNNNYRNIENCIFPAGNYHVTATLYVSVAEHNGFRVEEIKPSITRKFTVKR